MPPSFDKFRDLKGLPKINQDPAVKPGLIKPGTILNPGTVVKPGPAVDQTPPTQTFPKEDGLTTYAAALKKEGQYPLKPRPKWRDRNPKEGNHPVATPFLVIPNYPGDQGARPLGATQARYFAAIEILDGSGAPVITPVVGKTYTLRCTVENIGAVGCYAGIAEFYVTSPSALDALASGAGARPAPVGYAGVDVPPGGQSTVTCQRTWTCTDANSSILVRIYDPIIDRTKSYDPAADRHVARRDLASDLTGTYVGTYQVTETPGSTYQIKIVIAQTGLTAAVSMFSQLSGTIPAVPQISFAATVTGNKLASTVTEMLGGKPFTTNQIAMALTNPNLLNFTNLRTYMPGDGRTPQHESGNLPRV